MAAQLAQPPWLNPDDACTIAELVEDLRDIGRWSGLEGEELALAHVAAAAEALSAGLAPAERLPAVARLARRRFALGRRRRPTMPDGCESRREEGA